VWKEAIIVYFEVLSQHLPGGTEGKLVSGLIIKSRANYRAWRKLQAIQHCCTKGSIILIALLSLIYNYSFPTAFSMGYILLIK
jgi:hypothetical protein